MLGKVLASRYQLIKAIAQGGFGTTFLAQDMHLPGTPLCVVKQLTVEQNNIATQHIARRLFNQEAITLQKLGKHPQIPQLYAFFEENNNFFLVQELIYGMTLEAELKHKRRLSELEIIVLLRDCLSILAFVHDFGVIHRDIKPANLMRRQSDSKYVLLDFGAVKEIRVDQPVGIHTTVSIGTRGYTPDEQLRGKPLFASDIYALGLTCIQGLTQTHPLDLERDENDEIYWKNLVPVSLGLATILSKMVRRDPRCRYTQAREILGSLQEYYEPSITAKSPVQLTSEASTEAFPQAVTTPTMSEEQFQASLVSPSPGNSLAFYQPNENLGSSSTHSSLETVTTTSMPVKSVAKSSNSVSAPNLSPHQPKLISLFKGLTRKRLHSSSACIKGLDVLEIGTQKQKTSGSKISANPLSTDHSNHRPISNLNAFPQGIEDIEGYVSTGGKQERNTFQKLSFQSRQFLISRTFVLFICTGVGVFWLLRPSASDKVVTQLETLHQQKQYTKCIQSGETANDNPDISESSIREAMNKCYLGAAQEKASQGKYLDALKIISKLSTDSKRYPAAQQKMNAWSTNVLSQAKHIYGNNGKLQEALELIRMIPQSSHLKAEAVRLESQWDKEHKINEKLIQEAKVALDKGHSEAAIAKAKQVKQPKFWQQKSKKVIKAAKAQIAERDIIVLSSPAPTPSASQLPPPTATSSPVVPVGQPTPTPIQSSASVKQSVPPQTPIPAPTATPAPQPWPAPATTPAPRAWE